MSPIITVVTGVCSGVEAFLGGIEITGPILAQLVASFCSILISLLGGGA